MKRLISLAGVGVLFALGCSETPVQPVSMGMLPQGSAGVPGVDAPVVPIGPTAPAPATVSMPVPVTPGVASAGASAAAPVAGSASTPQPSAAAGAGSPTAQPMMPALTDTCPTCSIPVECRGFSFDGIKYSPGGTTLPNKCLPYDATLNNPYAVRCIDALPNFKTPYAGDEYCILPPPPDKGMQVGLHPHGNSAKYWQATWAGDLSGYTNPKAEWVLQPGDELTQNFRTHDASNATDKNYYRTYFRMRTGSHHMIVTMHDSMDADGWIPGIGEALPGLFDPGSGEIKGILGGEQRPDDNTPVTLDKPTEDDGLYLVFPGSAAMIFNMHHFNITDKPLLREGWINIWWEEDARQIVRWYMGMEPTQVIGLSVAPGATADLHYSWPITTEMRLIRVFGHRHFWTTNFSTWIKRADGRTELAYQSYDWFDMPTYRYDSVVKNPVLDPTRAADGALSGIVTLKPGDALHFNCHIEFTDERRAADPNAPKPSQVGALRFANEAFNGEMCIQFGNVTGGSLGLPGIDVSPVPDFAKVTRSSVRK